MGFGPVEEALRLDERRPTVPELVAALCARLAEQDGPLVTDEDARAAADTIVAALREGTEYTALADLFAELEGALRRAGLAHGLGAGGFRVDPPGGGYRQLLGAQARAVHKVLRCPAERPCERLERDTWATRAQPPLCAVHGGPLLVERLRR
jgi:hypothetical protein